MGNKIGKEELLRFSEILSQYKSQKARLERRIIASENWWKLRNGTEDEKSFAPKSGWLHNVIVSKHADAMESFPEPVILPREESDKEQAKMLSSIIPCVLEQNNFESVYSDVQWQKLKTGTGVYKIIWDKNALSGLGEISVARVNILNLFFEGGINDIQKSRYVFHTELCDIDDLCAEYPQAQGEIKSGGFTPSRFLCDDYVSTENKTAVIEVYYKKRGKNGKTLLHYCKYAGDVLLYATENSELAETGLYAHGLYPFVFDALYPVEGSPCGYGYIDICKSPQQEIDLLNSAFLKNALAGATPRYFERQDGSINEEEFLNLQNPIVHTNGNLGDDSIKPISHTPLGGGYISVLDRAIDELRETSGNTETSTGNISSGVTAASAIAALQEASGKGARDSTQTSYRAFSKLVYIIVELIREFYTVPRKFRITGYSAEGGFAGEPQFVDFENSKIVMDEKLRLPVFDIKVSAQKRSAYSKLTQNELALQLWSAGMFKSENSGSAAMCLAMMDFDGKDKLLSKLLETQKSGQENVSKMLLSYSGALARKHGDAAALSQIENMTSAVGGR